MRFSTFVLVLLFASWTFALPLPGTPTEAVPYPSPRSAKNPPAAKPPQGAKPPNTAKPPTGQPPAAKAPAAKPPTGKPPGGKSPLDKIGSIFHPHEDKFSFNFHGFRSVEDPIREVRNPIGPRIIDAHPLSATSTAVQQNRRCLIPLFIQSLPWLRIAGSFEKLATVLHFALLITHSRLFEGLCSMGRSTPLCISGTFTLVSSGTENARMAFIASTTRSIYPSIHTPPATKYQQLCIRSQHHTKLLFRETTLQLVTKERCLNLQFEQRSSIPSTLRTGCFLPRPTRFYQAIAQVAIMRFDAIFTALAIFLTAGVVAHPLRLIAARESLQNLEREILSSNSTLDLPEGNLTINGEPITQHLSENIGF
ncbi:hypothetical protein EVG20_g1344 [Dentipellis fragilis]|uniref:Uncharacterized protein n=1 Tax=Dentipellis fragilis TaxID=205917 RepID=A0A4Y9ZB11_9AGAM|nr:hypothetical protein EVG20_g1344 [Dentipellis fragilis]